MMKKSLGIFALLLNMFAVYGYADSPVITDNQPGVKAASMGNNFTALADDYSAVYWNPAGLGFLPVREISVEFGAVSDVSVSKMDSKKSTMSGGRFMFNSIGLLRSIPVSRGGFAFAVGLSSPYKFDKNYSIRGTDTYSGPDDTSFYAHIDANTSDTVLHVLSEGEKLLYGQFDKSAYGNLYFLNFSAGWQVAPAIGLGFTFSPVLGKENQSSRINTELIENSGDTVIFENSEESISRKYRGIDFRAGALFLPVDYLRIGLCINAPQWIKVYQNYYRVIKAQESGSDIQEEYQDEGIMNTPFRGTLGFALKTPFMNITSDASFRSPFADANLNDMRSEWRLAAGAGVEVPVPVPDIPVRILAGYKWKEYDPYPYRLYWGEEEYEAALPRISDTKDIHIITAGIGVSIKDYAVISGSYGYTMGGYKIKDTYWKNVIEEENTGSRFSLSLAIRY